MKKLLIAALLAATAACRESKTSTWSAPVGPLSIRSIVSVDNEPRGQVRADSLDTIIEVSLDPVSELFWVRIVDETQPTGKVLIFGSSFSSTLTASRDWQTIGPTRSVEGNEVVKNLFIHFRPNSGPEGICRVKVLRGQMTFICY